MKWPICISALILSASSVSCSSHNGVDTPVTENQWFYESDPLSLFGRWDLGYGETPSPKTVPDGSVDAKAIAASMTSYTANLKGVLDTSSPVKTFWMKFGTPYVDGKPFSWSKSQWKGQKLRFVPDVIDGPYTLLNAYIR